MDAASTRAWRSRTRWRLRGALTWPLFALLALVEGVFAHERPLAGEHTALVGGVLLAVFLNLIAVAAGAPLLARVRRRGGATAVPLEILTDRAAVALLAAVAVAIVTVGVVHHPNVVETQREDAAMRYAVYHYVTTQAPAFRAGLKGVDVERPADHLYRVCVPGPQPPRALCLIVQTDQSPPGISVDPDGERL
jgi:hypothetical protein